MTYFAFLGIFIMPPLLILVCITMWDRARNRDMPLAFRPWNPLRVLLAHVIVAVVYTTPWDNYLVATNVWWYDPNLVTGIVLGWVPIEEYTFFVLQSLLTGLWLIFLLKRMVLPDYLHNPAPDKMTKLRWRLFALFFLLWAGSTVLLFTNWTKLTYLGLELSWALFPMLLQIGFGGDILWHYRRLLFWAIGTSTLYLCIGDAMAIGAGTWTISPEQSMGILLGNLPIEEIIFFLVTNMLIVFGMVLVLARASRERAPTMVAAFMDRWLGTPQLEI